MKEKKLYEQWWFWVILGVIVLWGITALIPIETTADCSDCQELSKATCEYANALIDLVNTQGEIIGEPFETIEKLDCSSFD